MAWKALDSSVFAMLVLVLLPGYVVGGLCSDVERMAGFTEEHLVTHDYFDKYYVNSQRGEYFVLAVKYLETGFKPLVQVLRDFKQHAEFLPGYREIKVSDIDENSAVTGIRVKPDFSFWESRFSTLVELETTGSSHLQCWRQLDEEDPRVIEAFNFAPSINHGYWRVSTDKDKGMVMRYFTAIKPPIAIPGFVYRSMIKKSYREVFESIIGRAKLVTGKDGRSSENATPDTFRILDH
jgi:hypothetical protein